MPKAQRSGKRDHLKIKENGPNYWPTWSNITKQQLTETEGTTMQQEGYVEYIHTTEDLADGYSLTEAVTKYAERANQAEERIAQMEAKSKEKIAMVFMQKPPQPTQSC